MTITNGKSVMKPFILVLLLITEGKKTHDSPLWNGNAASNYKHSSSVVVNDSQIQVCGKGSEAWA